MRLLDEALSITLTVTNRSDSKMPVGLGLHPYFLRTPRTRLSAAVADMWATDDQVLPTRRVKPPRNADPSLGIELSAVELDNVFTGWTGRAEITWPEWDARLQIAADPPLAFLVVYSPPTEDLFCVEPVSNITDALNMAPEREDTGLIVLEPGATASACAKFIPEISSEPSKRSVP